jgi:hypothetical protein
MTLSGHWCRHHNSSIPPPQLGSTVTSIHYPSILFCCIHLAIIHQGLTHPTRVMSTPQKRKPNPVARKSSATIPKAQQQPTTFYVCASYVFSLSLDLTLRFVFPCSIQDGPTVPKKANTDTVVAPTTKEAVTGQSKVNVKGKNLEQIVAGKVSRRSSWPITEPLLTLVRISAERHSPFHARRRKTQISKSVDRQPALSPLTKQYHSIHLPRLPLLALRMPSTKLDHF